MVGKHDERATIWGLDCTTNGCTTSNDNGLGDSTWGETSRAHQYFQYANSVPPGNATGGETYGGATFTCRGHCIDRDIEWAQVDGGNDAKAYTFTSTLQENCYVGDVNDTGMGQGNDSPEGAGECATTTPFYGYYFNFSTSTPQETLFSYPGSTGGTSGYGINNHGNSSGSEVAGLYYPVPGYSTVYGFIVPSADIPSGTGFQQLAYPGMPITMVYSINDDDQVIGTTKPSATCPSGAFFYDSITGKFYTISDPNALNGAYVFPTAVNGFGQVAGYYEDKNGKDHGFIWDWRQQKVTNTLDVSSCRKGYTRITGINNNEQVTGFCVTSGDPSFLYDFFHGTSPQQTPSAGQLNDIPDIAYGMSVALSTPQ